MIPFRTLLAALFLTLLCTCGPATPPESDGATATTAQEATAFPSIPIERLKYLYDNATYLDATFYSMPISINQNTLPQIRNTMGTISPAALELRSFCQPIGRIWFQVDGKNVEEADIYYADGCLGYVWMENGQPTYGNRMTEQGVAFYQNIFTSVKTQSTGQQ